MAGLGAGRPIGWDSNCGSTSVQGRRLRVQMFITTFMSSCRSRLPTFSTMFSGVFARWLKIGEPHSAQKCRCSTVPLSAGLLNTFVCPATSRKALDGIIALTLAPVPDACWQSVQWHAISFSTGALTS